jgi:hypothetical protein
MPTDKPRVMLTLDPDTHQILKEIADETGVPVAKIIGKLMGAHLHELAEYAEWLKKEKDLTMKLLGRHLIECYGPDDLIAGIRRIDPKHKFVSDQFETERTRKKAR